MIYWFVIHARFDGSAMGCRGSLVSLTLQFVDSFFHFFARLERDHKLFRDKDFLACPRIAGLASRPPFYLEHAKIPQLNPLLINKRFDDGVESLLNDFLCLELSKSDLLGNGLNDLFFGHDEVPCATPQSGAKCPCAR
jgi:hypothetical protein